LIFFLIFLIFFNKEQRNKNHAYFVSDYTIQSSLVLLQPILDASGFLLSEIATIELTGIQWAATPENVRTREVKSSQDASCQGR
jgi:hypothetical protein